MRCVFSVAVLLLLSAATARAADLTLQPVEQELVDRTNAERARFGLRALIVDHRLMATARRQSQLMTTNGMQHGFTAGWAAENIAAGQMTAGAAMHAWMNSSGHRANILGGYSRIGVSCCRSARGTSYWTQQFGR